MIECVLFDLDCTLHKMDQRLFLKEYLGAIGGFMAKYGFDPKTLADVIMKGTNAMIRGDGSRTNFEVFWSAYADIYGDTLEADKPRFDVFYNEVFDTLRGTCAPIDGAAEAVRYIKKLGLKTVLASNPVFPMIAQLKRLGWAGLKEDDFRMCTSFENCHYCKPNPRYFTEVAAAVGVKPENCLMVGNDVQEDIVAAEKAGMDVFLLPEYLINPDGADISKYRRGKFPDLIKYIESELAAKKCDE